MAVHHGKKGVSLRRPFFGDTWTRPILHAIHTAEFFVTKEHTSAIEETSNELSSHRGR